ncbi:hypothetical protein AMAG_14322 [Allomyces macrogynus ATCC 38327]|uniref:G-protein coupled receptors family 3 profile domain-containing protein n=1 Tax=Allomyces macrogynus (strain ATCC 38327) TaxID=578462 RepID=A0A0L0T4N0_ALLM3|nr:hypothetical protein AMAG_14322 [Allomyces macrogynus ATCC 38327]|eukprot:KNE69783.1 hypothetical protein AMAG_14322 [Allomyces macrogynus ATCC 38327]
MGSQRVQRSPARYDGRSAATIAVVTLVAMLFLTSNVANALGVRRGTPQCLPPSSVASLGWVGTAVGAGTIKQAPVDIVLEADAWTSTYIAATLLQDVMGVNVTVLEFGGSSGTYPRVASSQVHANLEVWPNSKTALYQQFIVQQGAVEDSGMIGYAAKISWYINTAIANAYPTLIFDSWRSYTMNSVLQYLPAYGTTTPARKADGSWLCDSATYSYCSNGMFIPPQCQANPSGCREFWHVDPSYSTGENEQRIITLGLKLVVVYLGAAFDSSVMRCANQNSFACLFYYWKPEILPSTLSLSVVSLPEYNSTCYSQFSATHVGTSSNALMCDWTPELLMKISTASLRSTAPHVSMFFKQFSLKDNDINYLLNDYAMTGVTETTACKWITSNRNLWTAWISSPPANYIMTLDAMNVSEALLILIAVLCALDFSATLPTFHLLSRYAGTAAVKAQSPRFMQLIALGVLIVTISVALEAVSPTITGVCTARIWLLALGMCTVLGSIIVKTARIYLIFGNRRRMKLNVKDARLLGGVFAMVAVDVVLLGAWTGAAKPSAVIATVSTTTYTYLCSASSDTGGTAITAILAIFHALQLLVACWLSFKIRNVGTTYNESKYIALAAYNILLACIVVVPVAVLPINFRAQFVIKCVCILLALGGVLGLLVWRPILEVVLSGAVSTDALASFEPPSTAKLDRSTSMRNAMAKSDKGKEGVLCGLEARVGQRFAIKQIGGLFRQWTEVDLVLLHHPLPSLQIMPCGSLRGGQAYMFKVYASVADGATDCFILRVGGSSYLVQAKDATDAERWVQDIETTFKAVNASTTGSVSRASSGNSAAASATVSAAPDQSVASQRQPGPQRPGMVG